MQLVVHVPLAIFFKMYNSEDERDLFDTGFPGEVGPMGPKGEKGVSCLQAEKGEKGDSVNN